jgi:arylsulfatase A-like enzyme
MNERDAIQFLQDRPKDKPFCLTVCFFTPHAEDDDPRQYLVQNESLSLYINATIPSAPSATEDAWKRMPYFFIDINEGRSRFFWRFDSPDKYQTMMKNYYRLISEIDSTSGEVVCLDNLLVKETELIMNISQHRTYRKRARRSRHTR